MLAAIVAGFVFGCSGSDGASSGSAGDPSEASGGQGDDLAVGGTGGGRAGTGGSGWNDAPSSGGQNGANASGGTGQAGISPGSGGQSGIAVGGAGTGTEPGATGGNSSGGTTSGGGGTGGTVESGGSVGNGSGGRTANDETGGTESAGGTDPGTGGNASGGADDGGAQTGGVNSGGTPGTGGGGVGDAGTGGVAGEVQLPPGMHWDFEALSQGAATETSGLGQSLEVANATLGQGLVGSSLVLAGGGTSVHSATSVIDTTGSYSVSVWVRLDEVGTYNTFVSQDAQRLSAFYLQLRDGEAFAFTTFPADDTGASPCIALGAMRPRSGEWYHLVATRNAVTGEQRLYQDGILVATADCASSFAATGSLAIGRGLWDGAEADFVSGSIDELRITDTALSPENVVDIYLHDRPDAKHYLFAYFAEQAQGRGDGLRLAHSHDGLYWGAIGDHRVFMPPEVGGGSFRDPHVMQAPDGNYHLVWTTSCVPWAESGCVQDRGFGHAQSPDLVTWSEQSYIPVALEVEHVWAPETLYDTATSQFMVVWSSPLDLDPGASDAHSIYYMLTEDFGSFTSPEVLYQKTGRNFIDATLYQSGDGYLMFLKDEADGQKNLRVVSSQTLFGSNAWTAEPSSPLTGDYAAEGPSPLETEGRLVLYFDKYGEGAYGALQSDSLSGLENPEAWEDISSSVYFAGVRHGTAIQVPTEVFRRVALKAGE